MRLCCLPHAYADVRAWLRPRLLRLQARGIVAWRWFTGATQSRWRTLRAAVASGELAL